jgi:hypothetical protein
VILRVIQRYLWPEAPPPPSYLAEHPEQKAKEFMALNRISTLEHRLRIAEERVGITRRDSPQRDTA